MAVCYQCQLPVLPLDRPVPKHVLSRRGAISFSSSSSLFGCANPRLLSQTFTNSSNLWIPSSAWGECFLERRGAISYDSSDQTALYIRMLGDVRVRNQTNFVSERRGSLYIDFHLLHLPPESEGTTSVRKIKRLLSFQRYFHTQRLRRAISSQNFLSVVDIDCSSQAKCMLEKVGSWKFDIFRFHQITNGNSLVSLTFYLFKLHGLIEYFHLDVVKLRRFLVMVQEDYHYNNPYHNVMHAADVTQAMHCYLLEPELAKSVSPRDIMIALLASITHDMDHPGVNQPFLIKTRHYLAHLYKNTSVLENHHWRSAVCMLQETQLFSHLPVEDNFLIESQLGSLILATDINRQAEFLTKLQIHLDGQGVTLDDAGHRHFMLQIALKCADICNPCRTWELSKQWGERISEEFFHQGDVEILHDLEVGHMFDRRITTVPKIQIDFINYVVEPLFIQWSRFFKTILSRIMHRHLNLNKAIWKGMLQPQAIDGNVTDATCRKRS